MIFRLISCINFKLLKTRNKDSFLYKRFIHTNKAQHHNKLPHDKSHHQAHNRLNQSAIDRERIRNIGIIAHINAGKTTTTERILFHSGSTEIVGDVDRGNTITDYLVQERDRGITITSAAVSYNWNKHRVNLIDTPGHVDFTIEVERSLSVLDGAVTLLDASAGVEAQTVTVWNQAAKYKLPNIIYLNKCDKPQANFRMCMKDLKDALGVNATLIQIPVKNDQTPFSSFVDIVDRKHFSWTNPDQDHGSKFVCLSLIDSNLDKKFTNLVEEDRERLVNLLTDIDDQFAGHVIECDKISDVSATKLNEAIRRATLNCQLSPVLVGSSFKFIGVQQLMDAIINYLPSPIDRELQVMTSLGIKTVNSDKNCAFIFKIMHDKRLGPLSYLRVCNGSMAKLRRVKNLGTRKIEQIKKVYRVFADELREIEGSAGKDDIVVVTGVSESKTGDILVDESLTNLGNDEAEAVTTLITDYPEDRIPFRYLNKQFVVPQISHMEPVYFCSIEALSSSQQIKLEAALACLTREDPSFTFEIDQLGIITIRGMGKLHLEVIRDRIKSEHGIDSHLGPLQISYRETIDGSANEEISITKFVNSVKCSVSMSLYVCPKPKLGVWSGKMLRLDSSGESTLGKLRHDHRRAIENGFLSALSNGPSMGFPVIDCDILLLDFKANSRCGLPVISSAASQCLSNALNRCSPILLEPIMLLEVVAPSEFNSTIIGDISVRRGIVQSTQAKLNGSIVIRSQTPLASLSDYSEYLRTATSGRGSFSMELSSYSPMSEFDKQTVARS